MQKKFEWAIVKWMFNAGLAHRNVGRNMSHKDFFHSCQSKDTRFKTVYMFSKLSILLFVFPFLTSRSVLYLSVPDLSTSLEQEESFLSSSIFFIHVLTNKDNFLQKVFDLNCFVSSDSFSSSLADSRSFPSSSSSTVMSASITTCVGPVEFQVLISPR